MAADQAQHPMVTRVVRYGLPVVVLIVYLTAVQRFAYTPDSTYSSAIVTQNLVIWGAFVLPPSLEGAMTPSPLWALLQLAGAQASTDLVLFAKVFSLLFSCIAVVLAYLVANEVTDDRLLAFSASFVLGMQAWFLYLAPTGSALPLAIALTLGCAFFLLRNEYILAALLAGLATLVFWEGAVLFVLVIADLMVNSIFRMRALRTGGVALLVYGVVVSPWLITCARRGIPAIPALVPLESVPDFGLPALAGIVLTAVLALAGIAVSIRYGEGWVHVRTHGALIIWTALMLLGGIAGSWERFALAVPFLVVGAFVGIQRGMHAIRRQEGPYYIAFGFAVVMLLVNQVGYYRYASPSAGEARETTRECIEIGSWIKSHCGDSLQIVSDRPGEIGYRTGMYVIPPGAAGSAAADVVVASADSLTDYELVYRPPAQDLVQAGEQRLAVWKRRSN